MKKKEKKMTLKDLAPENFKSLEENEEAVEQYRTQTNYFQFFFGDQKVKKVNQEGKPHPGY